MDKDNFYKEFFEAFLEYYSCCELISNIYSLRDFIFRSHYNLKDKYVSIPVGFKFKDDIKGQLWCILVLLYGSYGVSPLNGWIEDVDGAISFLNDVEKMLEDKKLE